MKEELKQFNINLDDITFNNNLFDNLNEAIQKMKLETLKDRFEVVLNNNLIESKEKLTNYRTIMGCRISYEDLDRNISFIVREDMKPTYDELENEIKYYKELSSNQEKQIEQSQSRINKAIEYIKKHKETREHYEPYGTPIGNSNYTTTHIFGYYELLNILESEVK